MSPGMIRQLTNNNVISVIAMIGLFILTSFNLFPYLLTIEFRHIQRLIVAAVSPLIVTAEMNEGIPVEALPVFIATAPDVVPEDSVPGVHREECVLQGEP